MSRPWPLKTTNYYIDDPGGLQLHKRGTLWTIGTQASKDRFIEFEMRDEVACHVREFLEGAQCSHRDAESTQPERSPAMSATASKTFRPLDCPVCGKSIELHATYDVRLDLTSAAAKTVAVTPKMTGVRIQHNCQPIATRATRED